MLARQGRARFGLTGGIADHRREIADEKNRRVAQVLKMFELSQNDGVAQVQVGRGRVHAQLHAQRLAGLVRGFELRAQIFFANDLRRALAQVGDLFVDGRELFFRRHDWIWERNHAAALDAISARENQAHGFGVNAMLLGQDARGKRFVRVVVAHGHDGLRQNRPGIEIFIHQVHGAAAELHAVFERLPLRLKARETTAAATGECSGCAAETRRQNTATADA